MKADITEVDSVKFETSKLRENRDKARDMAMKAAQEKATAMSGAIGQRIGKAIRISEESSGNSSYNLSQNVMSVVSRPTGNFSEGVATFAPGAIKVSAQVTVSFLLN